MPPQVQEVAPTQPPMFSDYDLFSTEPPTIKTYYVKAADVQARNPAKIPPSEYLPPQYRDLQMLVRYFVDARKYIN